MKILLCSVPDGPLEASFRPLVPRNNTQFSSPQRPIGLLRILDWIEKNGYSGDIYDVNSLRPSDNELIKNFKKINPTVVGLSATLTHCYPNVKRITKLLRKLFPDIWIIVGGHITGSAHVVLKKNDVDVCVVGDGEICFVQLLDYIKSNYDRKKINYEVFNKIKIKKPIKFNNK